MNQIIQPIIPFLPANQQEMFGYYVLCALLGAVIATGVANLRKPEGGRADFHYIIKNIFSGASLPVAVALILTPVHPPLYQVFSSLTVYLGIAGLVGLVLITYSFVK